MNKINSQNVKEILPYAFWIHVSLFCWIKTMEWGKKPELSLKDAECLPANIKCKHWHTCLDVATIKKEMIPQSAQLDVEKLRGKHPLAWATLTQLTQLTQLLTMSVLMLMHQPFEFMKPLLCSEKITLLSVVYWSPEGNRAFGGKIIWMSTQNHK